MGANKLKYYCHS